MSINDEGIESHGRAQEESVEFWRGLVREQQQVIKQQEEKLEKLAEQIEQQQKRIEKLEAEIRGYKKLKGKPQLSASQLNEERKEIPAIEKRAGSEKRSKKKGFVVDEERTVEPKELPKDSRFNGYRIYDIQEIEIRRRNIRFKLAEYLTRDGKTVVGELPGGFEEGHFGPKLVSYILAQHYQCRVPQSLIHEQLKDFGIEISVGQVNRILTEKIASFVAEQNEVLEVGLKTAQYIQTDDTGAKHNGKNGVCTVIANEYFAYFKSSDSKSRQNFLETLQGDCLSYVLNEEARAYLVKQSLPAKYWGKFVFSETEIAQSKQDWSAYLLSLGIVTVQAVRILSEAALLGGLTAQRLSKTLRILSDGARQFDLLNHGLCWVHMERSLRKLSGHSRGQRHDIGQMQDLLWQHYQQLKDYKQNPSEALKIELWHRFDQVFGRCFLDKTLLNDVLTHFRKHKAELLQVLDDPLFPLHNNAAETDIREYVTRRKISGGTRSPAGRLARDTFVGLKKTCRKLGVSFWNFLNARAYSDSTVLPLPDLLRLKVTAP
jgi:uncharacterized coiled-coil protein SlyX